MHATEPKNAKVHALVALAITIVGSLSFALAFHEPDGRASSNMSVTASGADDFRANDDSTVMATVAASLIGAHDVYDALDLDP